MAFRGTEGNNIRSSRMSDLGTLEQSIGFRAEDVIDLSRSMESLLFFGTSVVYYIFICFFLPYFDSKSSVRYLFYVLCVLLVFVFATSACYFAIRHSLDCRG